MGKQTWGAGSHTAHHADNIHPLRGLDGHHIHRIETSSTTCSDDTMPNMDRHRQHHTNHTVGIVLPSACDWTQPADTLDFRAVFFLPAKLWVYSQLSVPGRALGDSSLPPPRRGSLVPTGSQQKGHMVTCSLYPLPQFLLLGFSSYCWGALVHPYSLMGGSRFY